MGSIDGDDTFNLKPRPDGNITGQSTGNPYPLAGG